MEMNEPQAKYQDEDMAEIREIANEIWVEAGSPNGKIINKNLFFQVLLALFISMPYNNIFEEKGKFWSENKEEEAENTNQHLENTYQDLINIPKKNFFAKTLKKKVEGKYQYYEAALKKRLDIQIYEPNYRNLWANTATFIQARERVKIEKEYLDEIKVPGPIQCQGCQMKWLKEEKDECPVCRKTEDISMYIAFAIYFETYGDMKTFYKALDPYVFNQISETAETWQKVKEYFRNKNHKRRVAENNEKIKEYGYKQYHKLVKKEGEVDILNEPIGKFNKKYDLALIKGTLKIDMTEAKNCTSWDFIVELSKIKFKFCEEIIFPQRQIEINDFKPQMPCLIKIVARGCSIRQLGLDASFFPSLKEIDLSDNLIETYYDIRSLEDIKTLRIISLYNNPILKTKEIFEAERLLKKAFGENSNEQYILTIKYNPEVRSRRNEDFDELSKETQKGLNKLGYGEEESSNN